jgi:hypothetical protein
MRILTRVEMLVRSLVRKYFPRTSMPALAYDPYDKEACEHIASTLLDEMYNESGRGALETCQRIIAIIGVSYPTGKLAAEYFSNLEILLGGMRRLENPGQLVIGLGPGRCGSTSLAAMLGTVTNSCCTHESPPLIFWNPQREQVDFHIKRFRMLTNFYSLVSDVSHWWLNSIERVFDQFPEAKVIGLIRDHDDCAMSFMRIQGYGKGSYNPWVTRGNGFWCSGHWDPTYPTYSPPSYADKRPDLAKLELITRYVKEYNAQLEKMARNAPDRVKLVRTVELGTVTVQEEIFQIAKAHGQTSTWKLNVKGIADGRKIQIKF